MSQSPEPQERQVRWIHPIHGAGVRSQNFAIAVVTRPLSNRKIEEYMRQGKYGETARKRIEAADARKQRKAQPLKAKLKKLFADLGL